MSTSITVQYTINAPAEKVWKALTDKNEMKSLGILISGILFWKQVRNSTSMNRGGENKYHHHAQILEIIPNEKLKHTWSYPDFSALKTIVTRELLPEGGQTIW